MATEIGALVLFTGRLQEIVSFYRLLGVPLEVEDHGDGADHFACDLGGTHFAVFPSEAGDALPHRAGGSQFVGLTVASCAGTLDSVRKSGAAVVEELREMPWGTRALVRDPDGRTVEIFQRP